MRLTNFAKLCFAEAISRAGTRVTLLALPVMAVLLLHAGPIGTAGILAAEGVPVLLLGLPAGAWIDRHRRKPMLIAAAILRALLLVTLPIAAVMGRLSLTQVLLVAGLVATLAIFGDLGTWTLVPDLVEDGRVLEASGQMQGAAAAAEIAGPGVGAALIQAFGAPFAVLTDAASYVLSALFIARIEEPARVQQQLPSLRKSIGEGLSLVRRSAVLSHCIYGVAFYAFFAELAVGIFPFFVLTTLHSSAVVLGLSLMATALGAMVATVASRVTGRRFGVGPAVGLFVGVSTLGTVSTAAAGGPLAAVIALLLLGQFGAGLGANAMAANTAALRYALAPPGTLARITSIARFVGFVAAPVGAGVGGVLAVGVGVRTAIVISAVGQAIATVWLLRSPVRRFRLGPKPVEQLQAPPLARVLTP